jgi:hypothetical protein
MLAARLHARARDAEEALVEVNLGPPKIAYFRPSAPCQNQQPDYVGGVAAKSLGCAPNP